MEIMRNYKNYRFGLDRTSKKFICPSCGKKRFVRYFDFVENKYLPAEYDEFGRCDREDSCGYIKIYVPEKSDSRISEVIKDPLPISFHDYSLVEKSQKTIDRNQFVNFLKGQFEPSAIQRIINRYKIGNAPDWYDGTIFWQIDEKRKVRAGKIIRYGENGRRFGNLNWIHSLQKRRKQIDDFNLEQCLFGLHLLEDNSSPIAIVESEKTACVMSEFFPKYLWMAAGSLNGLNRSKLLPIKDRKIIFYPDAGIGRKGKSPYEKWELISCELSLEGFRISISDVLENSTTELQKKEGFDLADFFFR